MTEMTTTGTTTEMTTTGTTTESVTRNGQVHLDQGPALGGAAGPQRAARTGRRTGGDVEPEAAGARPLDVALPAEPLPVALSETDLTDLVDVIVDNVFAHTPDGTALRVELRQAGDHALLSVSDNGPGFGGDRAERVGTSGLGLDIATRTAAGAGGSVRTGRSPQGGALVEVDLPVSRH